MLPVRHGKSEFISKYLPAWYQLTYPERHVLLTGYGNEFAKEWGAKSRDLYRAWSPAFGQSIGDSKRADFWKTSAGGSLRTCGAGGAITGKGCHLLISDDLVKDQSEANSPRCRQLIHSWFMSDALTRLEPKGNAIVVLSRRHPDDLVGRLLHSGDWRTLRIPVLAEDNDPLKRQPGEALWPARYTREDLEKMRDDLTLQGQSHIWECLYQQNPLGDPSIREWPPEYTQELWVDKIEGDIQFRLLSLDPSKSKSAHVGDYSVFTYLQVNTTGTIYVQSFFFRQPLDRLQSYAAQLLEQLRPDGFIYEKTFGQGQIGREIIHTCKVKGIPCPMWEFDSKQNKVERIRLALTPLLGSKKLKLLKDSPGNHLMLAQLSEFPSAVNDDGPDSLTMAISLLDQVRHGTRKTPEKLTLRV